MSNWFTKAYPIMHIFAMDEVNLKSSKIFNTYNDML